MRVLVTGGSGFIGKSLIRLLLQERIGVSVLTRSKSGFAAEFSGALHIYEVACTDAAALSEFSLPEKMDAVIHLAADLNYFGDRAALFGVNVGGTANMLEWARKNGVGKFIFISSIEAIGPVGNAGQPADELSATDPWSSYGESKLEAERLVSLFPGDKVILRLGNVYGPPSPAFIRPIAEAILGYGDLLRLLPDWGESRVSPVFISDAAGGIIKALRPGTPDGVYIIAGADPVTLSELFGTVAHELGVMIGRPYAHAGIINRLILFVHVWICRIRRRADLLAYLAIGAGGRKHRAYSIAKARRELGYDPVVTIKDGVRRTVEWEKQAGILRQ